MSPGCLSDGQIEDLEKVIAAYPEDICARGYLIAYGGTHVPGRTNHVIWMVEHHPEWDGFLFDLSFPSAGAPFEYDHIKDAWVRQVSSGDAGAAVLHHAAVFFSSREPEMAEDLLKRAILLEPDELLHVEELGRLYALSQNWRPQHPSFAEHAKSQLVFSTDWVMIAGALAAMGKGGPLLQDELRTNLREISGRSSPGSPVRTLPSQSPRYPALICAHLPLLRRCVDRLVFFH